jgi:glycosyltransferase involved in cell wall biosynthesis
VRAIYAGSLYRHKGVEDLLEVVRRVPAHVELVIAGGNPASELERLRALAAGDLTLARRVRFLGQLPGAEVALELARADLILLPAGRESRSQRYTSPLKLFEAMASGVPIVAARTASFRSVLRDGETAFIAGGAEPASLADGVLRAIADPERARAIGCAAREAAKQYAWSERALRLERFLSALQLRT